MPSKEDLKSPDRPPHLLVGGDSLYALMQEHKVPKTLDINSQVYLFLGISDPGRVRFSSQSNLRIEVVRNFFWGFQLYENYDSRPPVNAPRNDLGITTSLGWKFGR